MKLTRTKKAKRPRTPAEDKRSIMIRRAAWLGAIAALVCQALPPEHRSVCTAIVKIASLSCGGGS